jgi:hypothetical protein
MSLPYDADQPLVSIHIPKAAGTSVRACLDAWFGDRLFTHYPDEAVAGAPKRHALGPRTCVHGHFNKHRWFGVLDYYPDVTQWVTFLRDPFEQHVSLFFYLRKFAGEYHFAGRLVPTSAWHGFGDFMDFIADSRDVLQTTPANTLLAHLPVDFVKQRPDIALDRFVHVGITEVMDRSLRLLADKLGHSLSEVPNLNQAERDLPLDQRHRSRHEALFPLEHSVYQVARERFG